MMRFEIGHFGSLVKAFGLIGKLPFCLIRPLSHSAGCDPTSGPTARISRSRSASGASRLHALVGPRFRTLQRTLRVQPASIYKPINTLHASAAGRSAPRHFRSGLRPVTQAYATASFFASRRCGFHPYLLSRPSRKMVHSLTSPATNTSCSVHGSS